MNDSFNENRRSTTDAGFYGTPASRGFDAPAIVGDRSRFITLTYLHLFGAVMAFVGIEVALFSSGLAERIANAFLGTNWLIILGGFVLVSWIATRVSHVATSAPAQYLALAGYVAAEALIFVPLLFVADKFAPGAISSAALYTTIGFAGLTMVAFGTRKDFSFLRGILMWAGICAMLAIVGSFIFGFTLGVLFSAAMVALAGASILYDTSNIIHHYPENRYVAASLQLFASVALMLWYILRILMSARR